jgi:type IV secretion system protein VirB10
MTAEAGRATGTDAAQSEYLKAMLAAATGKPAAAEVMPDAPASSARFIHAPGALMVRGTYIRCVLETRIVTDIAGFTSCVVTEPVYSINGQRLLLPKGSKVSGRYSSGEPNGPRVAVIWDRITTPTGIDVAMSSPGVDNLGGAGHPGDYDAHWPSRISSALLISLIGDGFKYAAAEHGPPTATIAEGVVVQQPYESGTARTMERLANRALERNLQRPATVTVDPGEILNIYVARDIDFSAVVGG